MELFAKNRGLHVAAKPRTRDRAKSQLLHALHNAAYGAVSLDEVDNGIAECFAG